LYEGLTRQKSPTALQPSSICTSCGGDGTCKHCWSPSRPLLPASLFWGWTANLNRFVLGKALREDSPPNTVPPHGELELRSADGKHV